jgi:hypothetical protein
MKGSAKDLIARRVSFSRSDVMSIALSISSTELSDDRIQDLTLDLCGTLNRETDIEAELPKSTAKKGSRGEPITLGLILLTIIKSGSVVAFLSVLRSYLDREPSIKMSIKQEDGTEITIDAKNMNLDQIRELKEIMEK